jgi:hypothetical protein
MAKVVRMKKMLPAAGSFSRRSLLKSSAVVGAAFGLGFQPFKKTTIDPARDYYLFAYFRDKEVKAEEDGRKRGGGMGLYLAWSGDGLKWEKAAGGKRLLTATVSPMLRDPFVAQGPDGVFHLVFTSGWRQKTIGYARSEDLLNWTDERLLPVMENEPQTANCWAPELIYDDAGKRFMIYWSSTVNGKFTETEAGNENVSNHRIYYTLTPDFKSLTPGKLLYDPGFSCIDADIVKDGDRFIMFLKDETRRPPARYLLKAESASVTGPYGNLSGRITPESFGWSEGPSACKVGDRWMLYFDAYTKHKYGLLSSRDLVQWEDLSGGLTLPRGVRHGNAFKVSGAVLKKLEG